MPKRSSKRGDLNEIASQIVDQSTTGERPSEAEGDKNPHAVALGRMGGTKGGKARAEKLSAEQRSQIAKRAAEARWAQGKSQG